MPYTSVVYWKGMSLKKNYKQNVCTMLKSDKEQQKERKQQKQQQTWKMFTLKWLFVCSLSNAHALRVYDDYKTDAFYAFL